MRAFFATRDLFLHIMRSFLFRLAQRQDNKFETPKSSPLKKMKKCGQNTRLIDTIWRFPRPSHALRKAKAYIG